MKTFWKIMNPTLELTSQRQGKDSKTSELKAGSSDNYYSGN